MSTSAERLVAARDAALARRPDLFRRFEHAHDVLARYDRHEHDDEEAVDQALTDIAAVLTEATPTPTTRKAS
ncbi:hypothetical protein [Streptomyces sp. NPDC015131]|uniref:hypothetical protein n=1 Tax=Streptomyces sp. NPDC015131 TaxID=3364941 RepID=UPI0036FF3642